MRTQQVKDYHAVLGVPAEADEEMIRKAFRSRARVLHPDVSDAPDAEERFRDVAEAYQALSRAGRKPRSGRIDYRGGGNRGLASSSRDPLFEFWGLRRPRSPQTVEVELGHFEAARGARRTVRVEARESCRDCRGTGSAEGAERAVCTTCSGSGRLKNVSASGTGRMLSVDPCTECFGSGRRVSAHCPACGGVGDVWTWRQIEVRVPAGVEDGRWIRLAHAAGSVDAYVRVKVLPAPRDPPWIRSGALAAFLVAVGFLVYLLLR